MFFVALLLLMGSGTGCRSQPEVVERLTHVFDEPVFVQVPYAQPEELDPAYEMLQRFERRLGRLVDIYSGESEIARVNQIAAVSRFPVSRDTQRMLEYAQRLSIETHGAFDITDATLRHAWQRHLRASPGEWMSAPLIRASRAGVGSRKFEVRGQSVLLLTPDTQLDLNALAGPYIIDLTIVELRRQGQRNVRIGNPHFGRTLGRIDAHTPWTLPVTHPLDPTIELGRLTLSEGMGYAVFGLPEHYQQLNGEPVSRIIDPRSGQPVPGEEMAWVIGPVTSDAYALAQALFIGGRDETAAIWSRRERYAAMTVTRTATPTIYLSPALKPLFVPAEDFAGVIRSWL